MFQLIQLFAQIHIWKTYAVRASIPKRRIEVNMKGYTERKPNPDFVCK